MRVTTLPTWREIGREHGEKEWPIAEIASRVDQIQYLRGYADGLELLEMRNSGRL